MNHGSIINPTVPQRMAATSKPSSPTVTPARDITN
jgi:hypothetical protein